MLLPWNNTLQLQLGSQAILGTLRSPFSRREVLARVSQPVNGAETGGAMSPLANEALLQAQVTAVDAVLSSMGAHAQSRGAKLKVVMDDARVHFDLVAGDYGQASQRQLQSIATACVAELLGDAAAGHVVRWQLQPNLRHLLICSIEQKDVQALAFAASSHGLALVSLQPNFGLQWNRHADALADGTGVFATSDGGHAVVAFVMRGAITALSCGLCDGGAVPTGDRPEYSPLDARVNRLLASIGLEPGEVPAFVCVALDMPESGLSPRWTTLPLHQEAA